MTQRRSDSTGHQPEKDRQQAARAAGLPILVPLRSPARSTAAGSALKYQGAGVHNSAIISIYSTGAVLLFDGSCVILSIAHYGRGAAQRQAVSHKPRKGVTPCELLYISGLLRLRSL